MQLDVKCLRWTHAASSVCTSPVKCHSGCIYNTYFKSFTRVLLSFDFISLSMTSSSPCTVCFHMSSLTFFRCLIIMKWDITAMMVYRYMWWVSGTGAINNHIHFWIILSGNEAHECLLGFLKKSNNAYTWIEPDNAAYLCVCAHTHSFSHESTSAEGLTHLDAALCCVIVFHLA